MRKVLLVLLVSCIVILCSCPVYADSGGAIPLPPILPFEVVLIGDEDVVVSSPTGYSSLGGVQYYHVTYDEFDVAVGLSMALQPNIPYVNGQYELQIAPSATLNVTDVSIRIDSAPFVLNSMWRDCFIVETNDSFYGEVTIKGINGITRTWVWGTGSGVYPQQTSMLEQVFDEAVSQFGLNSPVWVSFTCSASTETVPNIYYYAGQNALTQIQGEFISSYSGRYQDGYSVGFADGSSADWFGGLGNSVGSFLDMEILPGFSFSNVLYVVIGLCVLAFVLKLLFL